MLRAALHAIRTQPSRWAIGGLTLLVLLATFKARRWDTGRVIDHDVISYYSYLPAAFIYGDMGMDYIAGNRYFSDKVWGVARRDGLGPVQKYSMGMAVMYAPFFFVGHLHAHVGGWTADGYTWPYGFWLHLSGVFYFVLGVLALRRVLRRYFGDWTVAVVLTALGVGTNWFYYVAGDAAMPHAALFALVALLMEASLRFYELPTWRRSLAVAVVCSLIVLVRPNHLLLWMVPALVGVWNWATFKERLAFVRVHWKKLLLWPLVLGLMLLPQLLYWKHLTTQWLYYSYGQEGFFFADPDIGKVLFSFRKGWLVYTPMMALAIVGLLWVRRYARAFTLVVPLVVAAVGYVLASWWCWWYGGSFGQRAFIDIYPLLAVGLAALVEWVAARGRVARLAGLAVVGALIMLNLFQALQYQSGTLHYDAMTKAAYVEIFGKLAKPEGLDALLDYPDVEGAMRGEGR